MLPIEEYITRTLYFEEAPPTNLLESPFSLRWTTTLEMPTTVFRLLREDLREGQNSSVPMQKTTVFEGTGLTATVDGFIAGDGAIFTVQRLGMEGEVIESSWPMFLTPAGMRRAATSANSIGSDLFVSLREGELSFRPISVS